MAFLPSVASCNVANNQKYLTNPKKKTKKKMEKYYFNEAQPRLTVGDGVVLLLVNGKEETEISGGMPDENGLETTEAVERKVWVYDGVRL